jgi:hypothetical protein
LLDRPYRLGVRMKKLFYACLGVMVAAGLPLGSSQAGSKYEWTAADPIGSQIAPFHAGTGVITVASVQLANGCQTPFLVAQKTPFHYDLKIRTDITAMCVMVIKDELVSFYEPGSASAVHVETATGEVTVPVQPAQTRGPAE